MPNRKTAHDLAWQYADDNPQQQFAYSADGATVGMWYANYGKFQAIASLTITGHWYAAPHVLVNEQEIIRQWVPWHYKRGDHMKTETTDGYTITTIEQSGDYAGKDVGRLWLKTPHRDQWSWYGNFADEGRRAHVIAQAQTMTFKDFDEWWEQTTTAHKEL